MKKGFRLFPRITFKLSKTIALTPTKSKTQFVNNAQKVFVESIFGLGSLEISLKQNTIYHERKWFPNGRFLR